MQAVILDKSLLQSIKGDGTHLRALVEMQYTLVVTETLIFEISTDKKMTGGCSL